MAVVSKPADFKKKNEGRKDPYPAVPSDTYIVEIVRWEERDINKDRLPDSMAWLKKLDKEINIGFKIVEGPFANTWVWGSIPVDVYSEAFWAKLRAIHGLRQDDEEDLPEEIDTSDSEYFIGRQVRIEVTRYYHEKSDSERNRVTKYFAHKSPQQRAAVEEEDAADVF